VSPALSGPFPRIPDRNRWLAELTFSYC
jgi:hypothetical protein